MAWAPEFFEFPEWAAGVDLMFADAAGWAWPTRLAHRAAVEVARQAVSHHLRRLVFAHIGRPTVAAIDAGLVLADRYEWPEEGIIDPSIPGPSIAAAEAGPSKADNVRRHIG